MLSFESEKRPTVAQILQQRFVRDRIKVFLSKQRPNSAKKERKKESAKPVSLPSEPNEQDDLDTMVPQVGTLNQNPAKPAEVAKVDKGAHIERFLSDAAHALVEQTDQVPETFVVKRNVEKPPERHPVIEQLTEKLDETVSSVNDTLSATSTARERRRQQRIEKQKNMNEEGQKFIELLKTTVKQKHIPEQQSKSEKPAVLAGNETLTR